MSVRVDLIVSEVGTEARANGHDRWFPARVPGYRDRFGVETRSVFRIARVFTRQGRPAILAAVESEG